MGNGKWKMEVLKGVEPWRTDEADTKRIWWRDGGVHQNITHPANPDPISGAHCWLQKVSLSIPGPDEKYGEELCACVCLKEGEPSNAEDIRTFCIGQIAHYKIPRYVKFVDGFPMTVTGKIQKFKMREEMTAELALAEQETA